MSVSAKENFRGGNAILNDIDYTIYNEAYPIKWTPPQFVNTSVSAPCLASGARLRRFFADFTSIIKAALDLVRGLRPNEIHQIISSRSIGEVLLEQVDKTPSQQPRNSSAWDTRPTRRIPSPQITKSTGRPGSITEDADLYWYKIKPQGFTLQQVHRIVMVSGHSLYASMVWRPLCLSSFCVLAKPRKTAIEKMKFEIRQVQDAKSLEIFVRESRGFYPDENKGIGNCRSLG